jgi:chromosome segregation ATPase
LAKKTQEIQQLQAKLRDQELFAGNVDDIKNTLAQRNNEVAQLKQKIQSLEQQFTAKTNEANKAKQGLQTAINELRKQREETEKLAEQILEVELSKAEEVERLNAVIADLQGGRR